MNDIRPNEIVADIVSEPITLDLTPVWVGIFGLVIFAVVYLKTLR